MKRMDKGKHQEPSSLEWKHQEPSSLEGIKIKRQEPIKMKRMCQEPI